MSSISVLQSGFKSKSDTYLIIKWCHNQTINQFAVVTYCQQSQYIHALKRNKEEIETVPQGNYLIAKS